MKARLQAVLPTGRDWLYEVKLDGIRAIGIKDGGAVKLYSRKPRELTRDYAEIAHAVAQLPISRLIVDGEISALDAKGRPSFQLLQRRNLHPSGGPVVRYFIFDLLRVEDHDLKGMPLVERRRALELLMHSSAKPLCLSTTLKGPPECVWKRIMRLGLEGVVAKQKQSLYESGLRSGAWVKVKALAEQEFVIGGYTKPEGARKHFGAILVGYYDGAKLKFASKVGTGFDSASLRSLFQRFQKHRVLKCPFVNLPATRESRFGSGLTAARMRECIWLRPALVCQVRFMEWTAEGGLRQPVFLGLREDKRPQQVVREAPAGSESAMKAHAEPRHKEPV